MYLTCTSHVPHMYRHGLCISRIHAYVPPTVSVQSLPNLMS